MASANYGFQDPRLKEMVFRYRARNFPQTLNEVEQARWKAYVIGRHNDPLPGARTIERLNAELERLQLTACELKTRVLESVQSYVKIIVKSTT